MKKSKIYLSFIMCFLIFATGVVAPKQEVCAASSSDFVNDARWRNGISWGDGQRPKLSSYSSTGCCAYVCDFVKYVYGHNSYKDGASNFTNINEIREGDVIHTGTHYFAVLGRNGNQLYTAEGNMGGKVCVSRSRYTISGSKITYQSASGPASYTIYRGYHHTSPQPAGHNPKGVVDSCQSNEQGKLTLQGWAFDEDSVSTQIQIHVYIGPEDNAEGHNLGAADKLRSDVDNVYHCGAYHGFDTTISTNRTGTQRVRVFAINVGGGGNALLYDKNVSIKSDSQPPKLVGYSITELNEKGYTLSCTWEDNTGVTDVKFPTVVDGSMDWTWYQGTSSEAGETYATWTFTFSDAVAGEKYWTHVYAYDAAGNKAAFSISEDPIETKEDTEAPVIEDVTLEQTKKGYVKLQVKAKDDTGLGLIDDHKGVCFSEDKNSGYVSALYPVDVTYNKNCWFGKGDSSVPIIQKEFVAERTFKINCDSIIGCYVNVYDLAGNAASDVFYFQKSEEVKGPEGHSLELTLKQGESITLKEIRNKMIELGMNGGNSAYFDKENERIIKKTVDQGTETDKEASTIFTANEMGTEYIYFVNLMSGEVHSCKINTVAEETPAPSGIPQLKDGSSLTFTEKGYLTGLGQERNTVSEIREQFAADDVVIRNIGGKELGAEDLVGTGSTVYVMDGDTVKASCTVVLAGDVNGDGKVIGKDVSLLARSVVKKVTLSDVQIAAGDVSEDGKIIGKDVSLLARSIVGKGTISSNPSTDTPEPPVKTNAPEETNAPGEKDERDVSKNINLRELDCSCNQLSNLDVSKNVNLEELNCSSNQLSSLDLTNNTKLFLLTCDDTVYVTGYGNKQTKGER